MKSDPVIIAINRYRLARVEVDKIAVRVSGMFPRSSRWRSRRRSGSELGRELLSNRRFMSRARQFIAEGSQSKLLPDREEQVADHPADAPSTLENNQIR